MDQVDAQVVLSLLFWEKLSCAKSRILIRGGSKPSGPKTAAKYSTQYKSKESAAKYSTHNSKVKKLRLNIYYPIESYPMTPEMQNQIL